MHSKKELKILTRDDQFADKWICGQNWVMIHVELEVCGQIMYLSLRRVSVFETLCKVMQHLKFEDCLNKENLPKFSCNGTKVLQFSGEHTS